MSVLTLNRTPTKDYKYTSSIMKKLLPAIRSTIFILSSALLFSTSCFGFTITDADGNTIQFDTSFTRIISLYPAHTENLVSLGLQDQLIGVTASDQKTPVLSEKQVFSYHDDPEKFIAAKPDLILIRPMISRAYPQLLSHLQQIGITVISLQPTTVNEMFTYWRDLAALSGHQQEGERLIAQFSESLQHIADAVQRIPDNERPKVYFEAIHAKMKTFSPNSIAIYCLEQAGGINIASDATPRHGSNIAEYGKERILQKAGQIDFFLAQQGKMNPISLSILEEEPGFQAIKAIKNGRVALIEEELVSRPTVNLIDGIKQIHQILYPQH